MSNSGTSPGFAVVHQVRFQRECPPWALAEWGVHGGLAPRGLVNVVDEISVNHAGHRDDPQVRVV
jgi:hypothetical protein